MGSGTSSLSYLGAGGTVAAVGPDGYGYTPSGALTAESATGAGLAVMSDGHGDVAAAFIDHEGLVHLFDSDPSPRAYAS